MHDMKMGDLIRFLETSPPRGHQSHLALGFTTAWWKNNAFMKPYVASNCIAEGSCAYATAAALIKTASADQKGGNWCIWDT